MPKPKIDLILNGAAEVLTCVPSANNPIGRLRGVAVAIVGEIIAAIAPRAELELKWDTLDSQEIDLGRKIVAPGFVDCHTHLVFGGTRAQEFAARMTHTLQEVTAMGIPTGIQATVSMTRASRQENLADHAIHTLQRMFRTGTTTLESKSGYGLIVEKEIDLLQVNRLLQGKQPVDLVSTFLGAHDFPTDIPRQRYLDSLIYVMIPRVAENKLAEYCDVYCDDGYYTVEETRRILETGLSYGLKPKMHVDAYSHIGGSELAADLNVISADHLNYTTRSEMAHLAEAGVVGVVMPGLDFAVRHPQPFDARAMISEGMTLGLATDFCPGCWMESMQLVMQLACRLYQFSPEEALSAATIGAAKAVGLVKDRGSLEVGKLADIQVWDIPTFEDIIYRIGNNAVSMVIKRGRVYQF
ncbi:MAG: imidazolonepropionase [Leptolinea sp.]